MNIEEGTRIINAAANQVHSRAITVGFGMILVFHEKVEEATDYIAAGHPRDLSGWPFIMAEKEALGISAKKAAEGIINVKSDWVVLAASVEEIRLKSIKQLSKKAADIDKIVNQAINDLAVI